MKKIWSLALTLVLTAALFTGCGCTNTKQDDASTPTGMPTTMPTMPSTAATTAPTTQPTRPTVVETTPTGNGPMEDETAGTTDSAETTGETEARSRARMPGSSR